MFRRSAILTLVLTGLVAVGGYAVYDEFFAWKRFHVVEPGVLFRSGLLRPAQLEQAIDELGIKTVFSLTFSENDRYRQICQAKGVRRLLAYMPGDGIGPDDPYLAFLEIARDPANQPVLVHCSAGVQRTGGAVALYRTVIQGWSFAAAIDEMIGKGNKGDENQIAQLQRIHNELVQSDRCLIDVPKMANSRR